MNAWSASRASAPRMSLCGGKGRRTHRKHWPQIKANKNGSEQNLKRGTWHEVILLLSVYPRKSAAGALTGLTQNHRDDAQRFLDAFFSNWFGPVDPDKIKLFFAGAPLRFVGLPFLSIHSGR